MLSPVESLPVELFDIVSDKFSISDCQSLRLTSRQLHRLVHAKFLRLAFSERSTTLSLSSLDRLINVSSHRNFRDAVRCLHIRLLNHHEYANLDAISRVGRFPPPKRFPRVSGIRDKYISDEATTYAYVIQNERPAQLYNGLLKALEGLHRLKAIRFSMKQPASSMSEHDETSYNLFRNRCFEAVIFAMSHSKIKLEEFSMGRRKGRKIMYKQLDLSFSVFQLAPASLQSLRYCFSNLQSLMLSILTGYDIPHPDSWAKNICDFIETAPKLRKLTLSLDRVNYRLTTQFSQYSCAMVKYLATSCRLLDLETLEIMNCAPHGKDLSDLVQAHSSSLQRIVFSNIRLYTSRWCSMGGALKACQRLKYFRLVAPEDPWNMVIDEARIRDEPHRVWDGRKNNRSVFDWLHEVMPIDEFAEYTIHHLPINDNIHHAEANAGNHPD